MDQNSPQWLGSKSPNGCDLIVPSSCVVGEGKWKKNGGKMVLGPQLKINKAKTLT